MNLGEEYWLGLDYLTYLTNAESYTLRIKLKAVDLSTAEAEYSTFIVGPETVSTKINLSDPHGIGSILRFIHHLLFSLRILNKT